MSARDLLDTPVADATPAHAELLRAEFAVRRELRRLQREDAIPTAPPPPPSSSLPPRWGYHPSDCAPGGSL